MCIVGFEFQISDSRFIVESALENKQRSTFIHYVSKHRTIPKLKKKKFHLLFSKVVNSISCDWANTQLNSVFYELVSMKLELM